MNIILLSGKAGSGKDTVCEFIKEYYKDNMAHLLFAGTIKQYAKDFFNWDGREETKPREFLQKIGTDVIRNKLNNPNFHVNRVMEDIEILQYYFDNFVVTDARFPNEIERVKDKFSKNTYVIRINRDELRLKGQQALHESETALDDYSSFDFIIDNNSTLEDLRDNIFKILKKLDNKIIRCPVDEVEI